MLQAQCTCNTSQSKFVKVTHHRCNHVITTFVSKKIVLLECSHQINFLCTIWKSFTEFGDLKMSALRHKFTLHMLAACSLMNVCQWMKHIALPENWIHGRSPPLVQSIWKFRYFSAGWQCCDTPCWVNIPFDLWHHIFGNFFHRPKMVCALVLLCVRLACNTYATLASLPGKDKYSTSKDWWAHVEYVKREILLNLT